MNIDQLRLAFKVALRGDLTIIYHRARPPYEMRFASHFTAWPNSHFKATKVSQMPFTTHFYLIKGTPFMVLLPNWQKNTFKTFQEAEPVVFG